VIVWLDLPQNGRLAARCGDDAHKIPWVTIGNYDGYYLRKVIDHSGPDNPPMVRLMVNGEMDEYRSSQNVLAELPGATDEWVILTAHVDGYFNATLDNGSGLAAMMTLARYYAQKPRSERKRNMLFLAAGDHEVPGAGGTVHFAKNHADILEKTAVIYQLEHISSIAESEELAAFSLLNTENPRGIMVTNMSPLLLDLFIEAADRYGVVQPVGT
jgi:Zn-dependent M28 family amino/carboxypeptidase